MEPTTSTLETALENLIDEQNSVDSENILKQALEEMRLGWKAKRMIERSVLQEWVMNLPLRHQGTLLTGMRCCDVAPKNPVSIVEKTGCSTGEDSPERALHAYLRFCTLKPADAREVDVPGAWFRSTPPCDWKPSQFGHYPLHWFSHLMHCFQVVGNCHPDKNLHRVNARNIYRRLASSLHLTCETPQEMYERLTEDRIVSGTIVS